MAGPGRSSRSIIDRNGGDASTSREKRSPAIDSRMSSSSHRKALSISGRSRGSAEARRTLPRALGRSRQALSVTPCVAATATLPRSA
jgi:hypothetical protein